jgi:hypothetical protein
LNVSGSMYFWPPESESGIIFLTDPLPLVVILISCEAVKVLFTLQKKLSNDNNQKLLAIQGVEARSLAMRSALMVLNIVFSVLIMNTGVDYCIVWDFPIDDTLYIFPFINTVQIYIQST